MENLNKKNILAKINKKCVHAIIFRQPVGSKLWIRDHSGLEVKSPVPQVNEDVGILDLGRCTSQDFARREGSCLGDHDLEILFEVGCGGVQGCHELNGAHEA